MSWEVEVQALEELVDALQVAEREDDLTQRSGKRSQDGPEPGQGGAQSGCQATEDRGGRVRRQSGHSAEGRCGDEFLNRRDQPCQRGQIQLGRARIDRR